MYPRIIAAAIAFEVAQQVASVARSVFMTSQLYRRLSALSVLSRYCGVVNACRLPPVISCDTILMLFRSTSPLGDRASVAVWRRRLSVSQRSHSPKLHGRAHWAMCATVLRRIHTMRRRFGDRSAGSSVPSQSQLDRARTRFSTKIGSISSLWLFMFLSAVSPRFSLVLDPRAIT